MNAIVTGAGRGIGLELAKQLADNGYRVIAVDRVQDLLNQLPDSIEPPVDRVNADIGTPEGQNTVKQFIGAAPLHVLAHIAHAYKIAPLMKMDLASHRDIQRSNIEAPIFLTQALLENIKAANGACKIILVGAPVNDTYKPVPTGGSLLMSKVAIRYIANILRKEMKNIAKIGYIEPGFTKTPFLEELAKQSTEGPFKTLATKRIASNKYYSQATTGEWIMALLKQTNEVFETPIHKEDNPAQHYGVKFPDNIPERQGKWVNGVRINS